MKVNVAGAGAGKTTKMAELITELEIEEGNVVFCIAFTNAAVASIREKVEERLEVVPGNIRISTIHTFLNQELIQPYYYLLYGEHYEKISTISLPEENAARQNKLNELEKEGFLHQTKIPEKAKWVAYQKSTDRKAQKDIRQKVMTHFSDYCSAIFVDEAQDIDKDIRLILEAQEQYGVKIILYGDPKQDVKGFGQFKKLITDNQEVNYISICHRCPQKHLLLSNLLTTKAERQIADVRNAEGSIELYYETDVVNLQRFIDNNNYGLKYISKKMDRFTTHDKNDKDKRFDSLRYEVERAMREKWVEEEHEIEIKRAAFYITERMLEAFDAGEDASKIIGEWKNRQAFDRLPTKRYAQMAMCFKPNDDRNAEVTVISSIEIVKGLEAERCLFILSPDLAPYLFRLRMEDNKTRHLLYVALTRSLDNLTILVTKEVEERYSRKFIHEFFDGCLGS